MLQSYDYGVTGVRIGGIRHGPGASRKQCNLLVRHLSGICCEKTGGPFKSIVGLEEFRRVEKKQRLD